MVECPTCGQQVEIVQMSSYDMDLERLVTYNVYAGHGSDTAIRCPSSLTPIVESGNSM